MIVVPPLEITPARLTACNATDPLAPSNWSSVTAYSVGNMVTDSATQFVYQCLLAHTNKAPAGYPLYWELIGIKEVAWTTGAYTSGAYAVYENRIYQAQASTTNEPPILYPAKWLDVGPTNKYKMFDYERNTATVSPGPLTLTITPGERCDTIGFVGVVADSVQVIVKSAGITVYDSGVVSMVGVSPITNWYEYFTATFYYKNAAIFADLPPFMNMVVEVTFARGSSNVSVGSLVLGSKLDIGAVQYNPVNAAQNFSRIERDAFGNTSLTRRRSIPKTTQITWLDHNKVSNVIRVRDNILNGQPALWAGVSDNDNSYFDALLILGIHKQFDINVANPDKAIVTLELEEN